GRVVRRRVRVRAVPRVHRRRTRCRRHDGRAGPGLCADQLPLGSGARRDGARARGTPVRLLVVGPYPPPSGAEERQTMTTVRRLANDGDAVEVLSLVGSAAHHRGAITGTAGALDVWRRARSYDGVVLQVGTRVPLRTFPGRRGRIARLVDCLTWGIVLRTSKGSRIVVSDLD